MGFGSTAKKLQRVTEVADKLHERFEKLREQVNELTGTVEETNDRVAALEAELDEQRALLEALAEENGVDVAAVRTEAASADDPADATAAAGDERAGDGND